MLRLNKIVLDQHLSKSKYLDTGWEKEKSRYGEKPSNKQSHVWYWVKKILNICSLIAWNPTSGGHWRSSFCICKVKSSYCLHPAVLRSHLEVQTFVVCTRVVSFVLTSSVCIIFHCVPTFSHRANRLLALSAARKQLPPSVWKRLWPSLHPGIVALD